MTQGKFWIFPGEEARIKARRSRNYQEVKGSFSFSPLLISSYHSPRNVPPQILNSTHFLSACCLWGCPSSSSLTHFRACFPTVKMQWCTQKIKLYFLVNQHVQTLSHPSHSLGLTPSDFLYHKCKLKHRGRRFQDLKVSAFACRAIFWLTFARGIGATGLI